MDDEKKILVFFKDNWKNILIICLFAGFLISIAYTFMQKKEKSVTEPNRVNFSDLSNFNDLKKDLHTDDKTTGQIKHEIEYIHDGIIQPAATYYVTAPTLDMATNKVTQQIKNNDQSIPKPAKEKTDRSMITANDSEQKVEVYKINLRNNHKIKAGMLIADGKPYVGLGYQAGKIEASVYYGGNKPPGGIRHAESVLYTLKEW
jgi:predicted negative regulator of RcsB-dependent stress response